MSTIELEAQKASLAREILTMDDENMIHNIWLLINGNSPVSFQQKTRRLSRFEQSMLDIEQGNTFYINGPKK